MITKIRKRDGREVAFNIEKIVEAIYKASKAANGEISYEDAFSLSERVLEKVSADLGKVIPSVEIVQDYVEKALIEEGYAKTAKAYILYRADRTRVREMNTRLMKTFEDLTFKEASENDVKRENANIDGDTAMGTMLKYGSESAKHFYEMYILNPKHSQAHKNGDIHIHDLDFLTLTMTCCQIDIVKLFEGGFCTGHGILREPNDIQSYSALACIAIQSNQNDQHGGQSVFNFDYGMATGVAKTFVKRYRANLIRAVEIYFDLESPDEEIKAVVAKATEEAGIKPRLVDNTAYFQVEEKYLNAYLQKQDKLDAKFVKKAQKFAEKKAIQETDTATYQAMEAFIHNLNTMHSRAGAQTPFSSINYGMDISPEGRMVVKNILLSTEAGLGHGETPIFPIQIFRVKEGINYNPEDPNYDLFKLACRCSAKRLFPNFSFQDAPFNLQYYNGKPETEISYMGCRTRVIANVYDTSKQISPGRGNLSFTSINLPRLGIRHRGDVEGFFQSLDQMMDLAVEQLMERFEIQARKKVKNFPFLMGQNVWIDSEKLGFDDEIREVIKHGTLSVGFIGLAETLVCLMGQHHGESEEAQKLGLRIVQYMRDRMDKECEERNMNFSLLATPAEGLSGRFVRIDKEQYGVIPGVTDRDYYTNSFHVPVYYKLKALDKIRIEAPYHALTNAGHISYVELDGDPVNNLDAFIKIVRAMKECGIGYGSINHPVDRDPCCGHSGIIGEVCPKCGRKEGEGGTGFERIRRITGYLVGTLDRFNNAKRAEVEDRIKHDICDSKAEYKQEPCCDNKIRHGA